MSGILSSPERAGMSGPSSGCSKEGPSDLAETYELSDALIPGAAAPSGSVSHALIGRELGVGHRCGARAGGRRCARGASSAARARASATPRGSHRRGRTSLAAPPHTHPSPLRRAEAQLREVYRVVQPWLLQARPFEAQRTLDKAFCSVSGRPAGRPAAAPLHGPS